MQNNFLCTWITRFVNASSKCVLYIALAERRVVRRVDLGPFYSASVLKYYFIYRVPHQDLHKAISPVFYTDKRILIFFFFMRIPGEGNFVGNSLVNISALLNKLKNYVKPSTFSGKSAL